MIPVSSPSLTEYDFKSIEDQIRSGWISSGAAKVQEFEQCLRLFFGNSNDVLAVSNGTTAIELAIKALELPSGSNIIIPDVTFAATINAAISTGLNPILAPVNDRLAYDEDQLYKIIDEIECSAIIIVHLYGSEGLSADGYKTLSARGLTVIDDCAESLGSKHEDGSHHGTRADAATFSFFANKLITTGEGGAVFFRSRRVTSLAKTIRDHGMSSGIQYWHEAYGMNCRMTAMQAALGVSQLERIHHLLQRRQKILDSYQCLLSGLPGLSVWNELDHARNTPWLVNLLFDHAEPGESLAMRESLAAYLRLRGIDTRPCFWPLGEMPIYSGFRSKLLNYEESLLTYRIMSLPTFPDLKDEQISFICEHVSNWAHDHCPSAGSERQFSLQPMTKVQQVP